MKISTGIQRLAVVDYNEFFSNIENVFENIRLTNVNVVWCGIETKARRASLIIFEKDGKYGIGYFNEEYGNNGAWKCLEPGSFESIGNAFLHEDFGRAPKEFKNYPIKAKLSDFFDDMTDEPVKIMHNLSTEEIEEHNRNFYNFMMPIIKDSIEQSSLLREYLEYYKYKELLGENVPVMPEFPNMFEIIEYYRINH